MRIRELLVNLTAVVRRMRARESSEVTHEGKPVAVVAPIVRNRLDELIARGEATPATRPLDLTRPLHPNPSGRPISEILDEQRADRS